MDKRQILKLSCAFALVSVAFCTRLDCVLKTPEIMMRELEKEQQRLEAKKAAQQKEQEEKMRKAEEQKILQPVVSFLETLDNVKKNLIKEAFSAQEIVKIIQDTKKIHVKGLSAQIQRLDARKANLNHQEQARLIILKQERTLKELEQSMSELSTLEKKEQLPAVTREIIDDQINHFLQQVQIVKSIRDELALMQNKEYFINKITIKNHEDNFQRKKEALEKKLEDLFERKKALK